MNKEFKILIEQHEGDIYTASVLELKGCHTQAKTLDELKEIADEAIDLYLEVKLNLN